MPFRLNVNRFPLQFLSCQTIPTQNNKAIIVLWLSKKGSKTKSFSEKAIVSILLNFLQNVHLRDKKLFEIKKINTQFGQTSIFSTRLSVYLSKPGTWVPSGSLISKLRSRCKLSYYSDHFDTRAMTIGSRV